MEIVFKNISTPLSPPEIERMENLLPPDKMERYRSLRFHNDRMRLLTGDNMVRMKISEMLNCQPGEVGFSYNEHGKPCLVNNRNIHFNLSHSGNYVVAAFHTCETGIDIEQVRPRKSLLNIAKVFMSAGELQFFLGQPEEDHTRWFYRFWAAKESFIKNTGNGISEGLQSVTLDFRGETIRVYKNNHLLPEYHFQELFIDPDYIAFVCTRD